MDGLKTNAQPVPQEMEFNNLDIVQYSSGNEFTLILKKDRKVYAVGRNNVRNTFTEFKRGQLGTGDNVDVEVSPVPIDNYVNSNVSQISVNTEHSLILRNGSVYSFGRNDVT
jgi:alpha-tubulin suppressor-like RCC1 family protein